jgi:hypothetical protein
MYEKTEMRAIVEARDSVLARYRPSFQPGAVETLDEQVLRSFLRFENNRHWSGLFRQGNRICADMPTTRAALAELVDETRPIQERTRAVAGINGMGKGIITAILLVTYPGSYGVWNRTSEDGLIALNLLPEWPRGASFGERYAAINQVLGELARLLDVDLWTLDAMWWQLQGVNGSGEEHADQPLAESGGLPRTMAGRFTLERHLHDYMFDNWGQLDLGREWNIFVRDGEPDAGYEFNTPVGRVDLLAKHKNEPRWLVVELKREKSSDAVVGQLLRYMGWIKAHLAEDTESVEGLIVATEGDPQLHYALSTLPSVSFKSYEVEFRLKDGPTFEEFARPS